MKQVVACLAQQAIPFFVRGATNRLHHFDLNGSDGNFMGPTLEPTNSILKPAGLRIRKHYRVMSKSGAGLRSRMSSGFQVISNWLIIVMEVGVPTTQLGLA